jgi:hypothetical protein
VSDRINVPAELAVARVKITDLAPDALNALLCMHLLHWKRVGHSFAFPEDGGAVRFDLEGVDENGQRARVPQLSNSIRCLPKALEAVIARGYKPTIHFSGRHWHVWVRTDPPGKPDASAKSLQWAVASAALDGCLGRDYAEIPVSRTREWKAKMRELIGESTQQGDPRVKAHFKAVEKIQAQLATLQRVRQEHAKEKKGDRP